MRALPRDRVRDRTTACGESKYAGWRGVSSKRKHNSALYASQPSPCASRQFLHIIYVLLHNGRISSCWFSAPCAADAGGALGVLAQYVLDALPDHPHQPSWCARSSWKQVPLFSSLRATILLFLSADSQRRTLLESKDAGRTPAPGRFSTAGYPYASGHELRLALKPSFERASAPAPSRAPSPSAPSALATPAIPAPGAADITYRPDRLRK
jgi:hypothetical protein